MLQLREILVPVDFSPASNQAVRYARGLAEAFSARLHLLHVIESEIFFGGLDPIPPDVRRDIERQAEENLKRQLPADAADALRAVSIKRTGSPFVEIVRYAREVAIDLIVVGSHGHGPIAHMLVGSVTERVIRKAHCPVLVVRQGESTSAST